MKRFTIVFAVAFQFSLVIGAAWGGTISYTVTNLGPGFGNGINAKGDVVGDTSGSGGNVPFIYSGRTMTTLEAFKGCQYTLGNGVNNRGQVVGYGVDISHAFLYSDGTMTDIGAGDAYAINDSGQVAVDNGRGYLYSEGHLTDMGISSPRGINASGQVVGTANNGRHAVIYSAGTVTDLGTLPGGATSTGTAISDNGQVTGDATTAAGATHAFLYTNGEMTDLGALGGSSYSRGYALNDNGQVVGYATASNGSGRAFLSIATER